MNKYTLHVCLFDGDEETLKAQLEDYNLTNNLTNANILNAYDDGDSFREWGEPNEGGMRHGQIVYECENDYRAEAEGLSILTYLLRHDDYLVSLRMSCSDVAHQPFAITHADNYEKVVL